MIPNAAELAPLRPIFKTANVLNGTALRDLTPLAAKRRSSGTMCVPPPLRTRVILCWLAVSLLAAASVLRAEEDSAVRLDLGGGQSLELVRIKAGTFQQGSPASEAGRGTDETNRQVTL